MWLDLIKQLVQLATRMVENREKPIVTVSDEQEDLERRIERAQLALDRTVGSTDSKADQPNSSQQDIIRPNASAAIDPRFASGNLHSEIDEALAYTTKGKPDITVDLLEKIRRRRWDELSPREKYRIHANLGNAKLAAGKPREAAQDYLRAIEFQANDEDARAYEALGYLLLGDLARAHDLAVRLCSDHPGLHRAHLIRVRSASKQHSFDDLVKSVPAGSLTDPEVALALSDRATAEQRFGDAEAILRQLPPESHEWPAVPLNLGIVVLQGELNRLEQRRCLSPSARERVAEASALFDQALERTTHTDPEDVGFAARFNRGTCRRILGDLTGARADFSAVQATHPSDERVIISLARSAYPEHGTADEAIQILRDHLSPSSSASYRVLYGGLLATRGGEEDLREALTILEDLFASLVDHPVDLQTEIVEKLAKAYLLSDQEGRALHLVTTALPTKDGPLKHLFAAETLWRSGRLDDAAHEADAARAALGEAPSYDVVVELARIMGRLQRYADAFALLKPLVGRHCYSSATGLLLKAAVEAGEDAHALSVCRSLRESGNFEPLGLSIELSILTRYSEFKGARDLLMEYLGHHPNDQVAQLNLTALAVQQGWDDLAQTGLSKIPPVDAVDTPQVGALAVDLLRIGPQPDLALDYAYALFRRFPAALEASRALIQALLFHRRADLEVPTPPAVEPGTAVCFQEEGHSEKRWIVIEDAADPVADRGEYGVSEGLAPMLLGKKVGDTFPLSSASIRERTATILEIKDKRIFRAHEILRTWNERFPTVLFMDPVPVGNSERPTIDDLAEIAAILAKAQANREKIESAYAQRRLPISSLAEFRGVTVFEAVSYLTSNPRHKIYAARGDVQTREQAIDALETSAEIVLDPTAVATLFLLDELDFLSELPQTLLLTEGALQDLKRLIGPESILHQTSGYIGFANGRLTLTEVTKDEVAAEIGRIQNALHLLEVNCQVIGGADLMQLSEELRSTLRQVAPRSAAEALAVANIRGALLWSDDCLLHEALREQIPSRRAWTQSVFMWAKRVARIDEKRESLATAQLLRKGYVFTSIEPTTLLQVCEARAWRGEHSDVSSVLAEFENEAWSLETTLAISRMTLSRLWQNAPSEQLAALLTIRLLRHLKERSDHRLIFRSLLRSVDQIIGLAAPRRGQLHGILAAYAEGRVPLLPSI